MIKSKKHIVILLLLALIGSFLFPANSYSQDDGKIHFQMTVKDYKRTPLRDQILGTRITIVNQDLDILYEEKQIVRTNSRGLASIDIGEGTDRVGKISDIDWNTGEKTYYIRILIDPDGGSSYTLVSNTVINSVPYALEAASVEAHAENDPLFSTSIASDITSEQTAQWKQAVRERHYPGDMLGGGIVFYVDHTGENGLLASTKDIAKNSAWSTQKELLTDCESFSNGMQNTASIVQQMGEGEYAAYLCDTLLYNGQNDWYLPSIDELSILFDARYQVNRALGIDSDEETEGLYSEQYWSSTQINSDSAYLFYQGIVEADQKDAAAAVRPIRPFSGLYDAHNYSWTYLGGPETELGDPVVILENNNGDLLNDVDGKRGTVFRPVPETKIPLKITFRMQTKFDPETSEPPTELFGTGDFRLYFGSTNKNEPLLPMQESNLGKFEGVQFRIHPHLDESPIRRYTYNDGERESHTCTSIWLRYIDPDKRKDGGGDPITGLISDECQRRGNQCGWSRVALQEDGFGLENMEETEVEIIITESIISIEVNGRFYSANIADLENDNDFQGDILRFDRITNFAIDHTNTSRGYDWIRIRDFRIFPLNQP